MMVSFLFINRAKFIALIFLALMSQFAIGMTPVLKTGKTAVDLDETSDAVNLSQSIWYLEDKPSNFDPHLLSSSNDNSNWAPNHNETINFGYSDSAYWVTTLLRNSSDVPLDRLLEIAYNVLDSIDIYLIDENEIIEHHQLGDLLPFNERVYQHRNFVYPIHINPNQSRQLLIKVKTSTSMQIPLMLWKPASFHAKDQIEVLHLGIYYGAMIVMALYNLFIFYVVRTSNYFFYVIWVFCMAGFMASLNGIGYQYLWPQSPNWNDQSIVLFLSLTTMFGLIFTHEFLNLGVERILMGKLIKVLSVWSLLIAIASFFLPYVIAIKLIIVTCLIVIGIILPVSILRIVDGYRPARFYTLAWFVLLVGSAVLAFNKFGVLPRNIFTENATQIGSALEVMFLSFALADRLNTERQLREAAQQAVLLAQQESVGSIMRYQELYNNAVQGLCTLNASGFFTSANPSMARILGINSAEELLTGTNDLPKRLTDFFPSLASAFKCDMKQFRIEGQQAEGDHQGVPYWVSITAQTVLNTDGSIRYIDCSLMDITNVIERQRL